MSDADNRFEIKADENGQLRVVKKDETTAAGCCCSIIGSIIGWILFFFLICGFALVSHYLKTGTW